MVGISWLLNCIKAQPQEPGSVRHTNTEYSWETASCTRQLHRDNPTPFAQRLSGRARRLQAGCRLWMQHFVCQLVMPHNGKGDCASVMPHHVMIMMGKGPMWTGCNTMFRAFSSPHRWSCVQSSWFFQQCCVVNRCGPSLGPCHSTVVISGWGKDGLLHTCRGCVGPKGGSPTFYSIFFS